MAFTGLFVFVALITRCRAVQMCTSVNYPKGLEKGRMLPGRQIENLTTSGIMTCSRACLTRKKCKSFNFNVITVECHLNSKTVDSHLTQLIVHNDYVFVKISDWPDNLAGTCAGHSCPLNSYCHSVSKTGHVCKPTGCIGIPSIENGNINRASSRQDTPFGTLLPFTCDSGFLPQGEEVCQNNGTWSLPVCVSVSSCSMVKQYQPDSEDGEYWLRLPNFDNYTPKIYCHGLSTTAPTEFVNLLNINYGIFPNVSNHRCHGETGLKYACRGKGWEVRFSKIRVNITNMTVSMNDATFANISKSGKHHAYGTAEDCYTIHKNGDLNCGTRGKFIIDLRGTGWRVSEDQKWKTFGWKPIIQSIDKKNEWNSDHCSMWRV